MKSYKYDFTGNVTDNTDSNNHTINNEYNALGKIRKTIYPGDSSVATDTVNCQYDVYGNAMWKSDSVNTVNTFTYDRRSRPLSSTTRMADGSNAVNTYVKYDSNGNKASTVDGNNKETKYTYNELNMVSSSAITVSGILQTTSYGYDANGNQTTVTDWMGNSVTNVYDPINRLIEKRDQYDKSIQKLDYYENNIQARSYDALNHKTEFTYDKDNRLLKTVDPAQNEKSQTYNYAGKVDSKFDGKNTTKYTYDLMGNLNTVTNAKQEPTVYGYDLEGNLLTVKDAKGNVLTREYNVRNKVSRRIDNSGKSGTTYDPTKVEEYYYFADGNLQSVKDRNGKTTSYKYYPQGWVSEKSCGALTVSYKYDGNGNQTEMTDSTGTTVRIYDELNRVTTKTVPGVSGSFVYKYDTTLSLFPGISIETTTDPVGNVVKKTYDKAGRLYKVTYDGTKTTTYSYYDDGKRLSVENDVSREEYLYYPNGLLDTLTNYKKSGTSLSVMDTYKYHYDAACNLDWKEETINGVSKGRTNYGYDELNRLKTVTEPGISVVTSYEYDKAGNRDTQTVVSNGNTTKTTYHYDDRNRLTGYSETLNGAFSESAAYIYDNNGNMTEVMRENLSSADPNKPENIDSYALGEKSKTDIDVVYKYDGFNRMVKSITGDKEANYAYNGDGLRVSKTVNGSVTKYLYEYDNVVLELDGNNAQKAFNVYGTNLIARKADGATMYYLYNGHADVTALIDAATGNIAGTYYYDAFGNITSSTGSFNNNITYAGYQYDKETGLYYLNARMYDPKIARFMQEDTVSGDPNDPLSLNLYTYCHNEPIMYTDPSGNINVRYGDNNNDVKLVQGMLARLGYFLGYTGENGDGVDGDFQTNTLSAVNKFKSGWNLTNNTPETQGVVGDTTWAYLSYAVDLDRGNRMMSSGNVSGGSLVIQQAKQQLNVTMAGLRNIAAASVPNIDPTAKASIAASSPPPVVSRNSSASNANKIPILSANAAANTSEAYDYFMKNVLPGMRNRYPDEPALKLYDDWRKRNYGKSDGDKTAEKVQDFVGDMIPGMSFAFKGVLGEDYSGNPVSSSERKWSLALGSLDFIPGESLVSDGGKVVKKGVEYGADAIRLSMVAKKEAKLLEEGKDLIKVADEVAEVAEGGRKAVKFADSPLMKEINELDDNLFDMWHQGSHKTTADSLIEHYTKHKGEVGAESIAQYIRKAEGFKQNLRGARPFPVDGATEGVFRYVKNGKYIDLAPDKRIISFGKRWERF